MNCFAGEKTPAESLKTNPEACYEVKSLFAMKGQRERNGEWERIASLRVSLSLCFVVGLQHGAGRDIESSTYLHDFRPGAESEDTEKERRNYSS